MFCRSQYNHEILTLKVEISKLVLPNTISCNIISLETSSHIKVSQTAHSYPNLHTHTWQGAFLFSISSRIYYLYCIICTSPSTLQKTSVCPCVCLSSSPSEKQLIIGFGTETSQQLRVGSDVRLCNNQQFLSSAWRSHFRLVASSSEEVPLKEPFPSGVRKSWEYSKIVASLKPASFMHSASWKVIVLIMCLILAQCAFSEQCFEVQRESWTVNVI